MRDIRSETEDIDASAPYLIDYDNEAFAIAACGIALLKEFDKQKRG
jgi:hypothetical protein